MTSSRLKLRALGLVVALSLSVVALGSGGFVGTAAAANTSTAPDCSTVSYAGTGAANAPYEVENVDQLQCLGTESSGTSLSDDFELVADIDASGTSEWNGGDGFEPIGDGEASFTGTFDGANHSIEGLFIDRPADRSVGLFRTVGTAGTVEELHLADATVTGDNSVGVLAGRNDGTVSNASGAGTVTGSGEVGGLVGNNYGTVTRSAATVEVTGSSAVGGLVGNNRLGSVITESYATGDVGPETASSIGGLVGLSNSAVINKSYATGNVTGDVSVGGVVGDVRTGEAGGSDSVVTRTYATGNVTGETNVGGLVGGTAGGFSGPALNVTESYWNTETTGQTGAVGTGFGATVENNDGLATSELSGDGASDNAGAFEFGTTWGVVATFEDGDRQRSYPFLLNNRQEPEPGLQTRTGIYAGGNGTASDPFEIANWDHLNNTRLYPGGNFTLVSDLDESTAGYDAVADDTANGGSGFDPIGGDGSDFTGTFDGDGHTITGLTIDRGGENDVGLFGQTDGDATVEGVGLVSIAAEGDGDTGGLVGDSGGTTTVTDVYATGTVTGDDEVGGLVGNHDEGDVTDSYTRVDVTGSGGEVGGLVGENDGGDLRRVNATGDVTGDGNEVGGLVGYNDVDDGIVTDAYATGGVTATDTDDEVGGLIGEHEGLDVTDSYATGNVTGDGELGGLVGLNDGDGSVADSYATGNVTGNDGEVGGLVGENDGGDILRVNATGDVTGDGNEVGGLVGYNDESDSAVADAYATGDVNTTDTDDDIGGLIGEHDGLDVTDSYATGNVTGDDEIGGLLGHNDGDGSVTDAYARGDVTGNDGEVGGLVGENDGGDLRRVNATGDVTGNGDEVGGLVGHNDESDSAVADAYATGDVTAPDSDDEVGGLIGEHDGLDVTDSHATGNVTGDDELGGLVGDNDGDGSITDSYATGDVTGDDGEVGGLVGDNSGGDLTDAYATGDVTGNGDETGGLVGYNDGALARTYATGDVDGAEETGGLAGEQLSGSVTDSYATGNVTADSFEVGGLVGRVDQDATDVVDSNATGDVSSTDGQTGGLVGENDGGRLLRSSATGDVTAGGNETGGLVGRNDDGQVVVESYATGDVTGDSAVGGLVGNDTGAGSTTDAVATSYAVGDVEGRNSVGGLVGHNGAGEIAASYAAGTVDGSAEVGGLVGTSDGTVTDAYWDTEASGQAASAGGTGLTTAEMTGVTATDTMAGFGFTDTWYVTASYPTLAWDNTDPFYAVNVTDATPAVTEGETVSVTATVTNWGADGEQDVTLSDLDGTQRDSTPVALASGGSTETRLAWETSGGDADSGAVTVASGNDSDTASVTVEDAPAADIDAAVTADQATADGADEVRFTVTLTDRFGEPVEGATVEVEDAADVGSLGGLSAGETSRTDADGEGIFRATSTDDGAFTVRFSAADAGTATATATFEPEPSGGSGGGGGSATPLLESDDVDGLRTAGSNVTADVSPSVSGGVAESQFDLNDVWAAELDYSDAGDSYSGLSNLTVEVIDIEFVEPTDTEVTTRQSATPVGDGVGTLDGDAEALGYLGTETGVGNDRIAGVTVEFTVPAATVESVDSGPEAVSMYRFDPDAEEWTRLDTTITDETPNELRYRVTMDYLSQFAVGVDAPETTDDGGTDATGDTGGTGTPDPSTPAPDDTDTEPADTGDTESTPTDDDTPGTEPGGGSLLAIGAVALAVLALLAGAVAVRYR